MLEILINHLNGIGLIFDMIGVFLLWKHGIPNKSLAPKGKIPTEWIDDVPEEDREKHEHMRFIRVLMDNAAYTLLFLGFSAQLASNYVQKTS